MQWSDAILATLVEGHSKKKKKKKKICEIIMKSAHWSRSKCYLKVLLFLFR